MLEEIQNLGYISPTQNPRHPHKRGYHTDVHTHTEALPGSHPSSKQALSRSHTFCKQTLPHAHTRCTDSPSLSDCLSRSPKDGTEPRPRFRTSSSILPSQSSHDSTMPLEVSQEIRTWFQKCGLGGYLHVIDAPPHPEA